MRNCANSLGSAHFLCRVHDVVHSFITRSSNWEERGGSGGGNVVREVPISEMVTYWLYVTWIPIFKTARSRFSRSRLRSLVYYAGSSSSSVYYLWRAARSSFSWLWSMANASRFRSVYIWLNENYIRYMVWYRKPRSPEVPRCHDSRYYHSLAPSDLREP